MGLQGFSYYLRVAAQKLFRAHGFLAFQLKLRNYQRAVACGNEQ